ncbi:MAG: class C beta-lactamase-related serine hydrolase, partial [Parvularculaceae bacterium]
MASLPLRSIGLLMLVIVAALTGWRLIGPEWRALLADPPKNKDVLFWNQSQRDAGFRMLDRLSLVTKTNKITATTQRELPQGLPLKLDMNFDAYFEENRHSAVVILHKGKIRMERYGLDFSDAGRWTSFSVGKSITSTLVGAAIKDGYIESVDTPVTRYIPELSQSPYKDVTIEQLLTMTSGV